jgi:hypothetical protein
MHSATPSPPRSTPSAQTNAATHRQLRPFTLAGRRVYARLTLWTSDVLVAARRICAAAGFLRTAGEPHRSFGKNLISETWERDLGERP